MLDKEAIFSLQSQLKRGFGHFHRGPHAAVERRVESAPATDVDVRLMSPLKMGSKLKSAGAGPAALPQVQAQSHVSIFRHRDACVIALAR